MNELGTRKVFRMLRRMGWSGCASWARLATAFAVGVCFLASADVARCDVKQKLEQLQNYVETLDKGHFEVERKEDLLQLYSHQYDVLVLSTLERDFSAYKEARLAGSGYLESTRILVQQLGSVMSDSMRAAVDEYVRQRLDEFERDYKCGEHMAAAFLTDEVQEPLVRQFGDQLNRRYVGIREDFEKRISREFPQATQVVMRHAGDLRVQQAKLGSVADKLRLRAESSHVKLGAGALILMLRKRILAFILRMVGEKITTSLLGKVLAKLVPGLGLVLMLADITTAERQLLNQVKDTYIEQVSSAEFKRQIFDEALLGADKHFKQEYDRAVTDFVSAFQVKEQNKLTSFLVHSQSPDAGSYFDQYDKSESKRNVVEVVVRVYPSTPDFAKYEMARKFEVAQGIGVANENIYAANLKKLGEEFFKLAESRTNVVRRLCELQDQSLIEHLVHASDGGLACDSVEYLLDRIGADIKGKTEFVDFVVLRRLATDLQRAHASREAVSKLAVMWKPLSEVFALDEASGAFFIGLLARNHEFFGLCLNELQRLRVPELQRKFIIGLRAMGSEKAKVAIQKLPTDALMSFLELDHAPDLVGKYGEKVLDAYREGGGRFVEGFVRVWDLSKGYSQQFEADWKVIRDILRKTDISPSAIGRQELDLYSCGMSVYDVPLFGSLARLVVTFIIRGYLLLACILVLLSAGIMWRVCRFTLRMFIGDHTAQFGSTSNPNQPLRAVVIEAENHSVDQRTDRVLVSGDRKRDDVVVKDAKNDRPDN